MSILTSEMRLAGINQSPYQFLPSCFIHKLMRYSLLNLSDLRRKCSNFNSMASLSMTSVQISELYFVCRVVFVMSYPYAKFQHDISINNGIHCICPVYCFVYFWTNDRGLSIMTLLSMTPLICTTFFIFKVTGDSFTIS